MWAETTPTAYLDLVLMAELVFISVGHQKETTKNTIVLLFAREVMLLTSSAGQLGGCKVAGLVISLKLQ